MKKGLLAVLSMVAGATAGVMVSVATVGKEQDQTIKKNQQLADKHLAIMKVYDEWLKVKQDGGSLVQYFMARGYKNIAIYGMSYLGESLVRELKDSDVKVQYGIDKNAENIYSSVDVINLSADLPKVDVIVVTTVFFFDEVVEELADIVNCPVMSLEDIVYEVQG
ncbi:MAG: hypothetical protein HFJ08_06840 [Lachnospiraceae bacterium]|nr:hypothetical protein [Lachnospiraceae bacterium]